jgi:hypothetical protein
MTETTVNRVAELYKEKSKLLDELSTLTDGEKYSFKIGYNNEGTFNMYGVIPYNSISQLFLAEIKKLTENHLKLRIEEIDEELKNL